MSDAEDKEIAEHNAIAYAMLETRFGALKVEAGQLEVRVMQLQREAADRRSLDASRAQSKREAVAHLDGLRSMIDGCAASAKQKALMRQTLAHLWTRVEQAIGEVRP